METRKVRNKKRKRKKKIISSLLFISLVPIVCFGTIKLKSYYQQRSFKISSQVIRNEKPKALKKIDNTKVSTNYDSNGSTYVNASNERCYTYASFKLIESSTSNDSLNFWFGRNDTFTVPGSPITTVETSKYNTYYFGENRNVVYLTFDESVDDTQANRTLDILKTRGVKATFFLTYSFIKDNPDLVRRMVTEGHICANGITNGVDMSQLASDNPIDFMKEIVNTEDIFKQVTGQVMTKICRFPNGKYSDRALDYANQMGYRTLFWSFAYKDWTKDLNSKDDALGNMEKNYHPGAIYLLHDVNVANADALDEFINFMGTLGYTFDLPTNIK